MLLHMPRAVVHVVPQLPPGSQNLRVAHPPSGRYRRRSLAAARHGALPPGEVRAADRQGGTHQLPRLHPPLPRAGHGHRSMVKVARCKCPSSAPVPPQRGAWRLWAARHAQGETRPLVSQPLPRSSEPPLVSRLARSNLTLSRHGEPLPRLGALAAARDAARAGPLLAVCHRVLGRAARVEAPHCQRTAHCGPYHQAGAPGVSPTLVARHRP